jgi:6-pyruvoyltetrahydropterin/6-carboxytetrahydropterin synthase
MTEDLCFISTVPFEAARKVDVLPEGHPSKNLHGHSFLAHVRAFLPQGWASFTGCETSQLEKALTSCVEPLDYSDLNTHISVPTD